MSNTSWLDNIRKFSVGSVGQQLQEQQSATTATVNAVTSNVDHFESRP